MKKIFLALAITLLLVSGCQLKEKTLSSDKKDIFEKKLECAKYFEPRKDQLLKEESFGTGITLIRKVFFSPIKNSCLYVKSWYSNYDNSDFQSQNLKLKDALTNGLNQTIPPHARAIQAPLKKVAKNIWINWRIIKAV